MDFSNKIRCFFEFKSQLNTSFIVSFILSCTFFENLQLLAKVYHTLIEPNQKGVVVLLSLTKSVLLATHKNYFIGLKSGFSGKILEFVPCRGKNISCGSFWDCRPLVRNKEMA